jgi:hypothetical protein
MPTAYFVIHILLASAAADSEGPPATPSPNFLMDSASASIDVHRALQGRSTRTNTSSRNQTAPTLPQNTFSVTLAQGESGSVQILLGNSNDRELGWSLSVAQPFLLYSNGAVFNQPQAGPSGTDLSVLEDLSLGMNLFGFGTRQNLDIRLADQFQTHQPSEITEFHLYGYKFESGTVSPFDATTLQIWDEMPTDLGAPIFGDTSTNTLVETSWFSGWRVPESETSNDQRPIMELKASPAVHGPLVLGPGTHWIDFSYFSDETGPLFSPPIATDGSAATGDALQYSMNAGGWSPLLDFEGTDTPQGLPFRVIGRLQDPAGFEVCEQAENISWLDAADPLGSIQPQQSSSTTLTLSSAGLTPGLYQATLCLFSNSAVDAVQTIEVSLEVRAPLLFSDRFEQ